MIIILYASATVQTDSTPTYRIQLKLIWVLVLYRVQRIYEIREILDLHKVKEYSVERGNTPQVDRNFCRGVCS